MASIRFNQDVLDCLNWTYIDWQHVGVFGRTWIVYCHCDRDRILAKRHTDAGAWQAAADMALKLLREWSKTDH